MTNGLFRVLAGQPMCQLANGPSEMSRCHCGLLSTAGLGNTGLLGFVAWDQGIFRTHSGSLRLLLGSAVWLRCDSGSFHSLLSIKYVLVPDLSCSLRSGKW